MNISKTVAWKRTIRKTSRIIHNKEYWSNGHFAIKGEINKKAVFDGVNLVENDITFDVLASYNSHREPLSINQCLDRGQYCTFFFNDGDTTFFDMDYLRLLNNLFPGAEIWIARDKMSPAIIFQGGECKAILMPVKDADKTTHYYH